MVAGGAARRWRVLHPERLPDNRSAPRPAGGHGAHPTRRLLAQEGAAAPAGPVPDARGRGGVGYVAGQVPALQPPRRRARRRRLREQLVEHRPRGLLLRPLRSAAPTRPPMVPGGGGAVLSDLALVAVARPAFRS